MYRKVKAYIQEHNMIDDKDTVIVGLSGGSDSVAMLYFLKEYQREYGFGLKAVHINHGIRGEEAKRDALFVENLCKKWEIPCAIYEYDVPKMAKIWKTGLEDAGRILRKEAFQKEAEKIEGRVKIAVAHNQNDVAETFIHNLSRGSGLKGLASMPPVSKEIIRPILCLEKKEIYSILEEKQLEYVTDSTNFSDDYTRNRIRNRVLPEMINGINPQTIAHVAKTAEIIEKADAYIQGQAEEKLEKYIKNKDEIVFTEDLLLEADIIKECVIHKALERIAGRRKDITAIHIKSILELSKLQTGRQIILPYNILAMRVYEGIKIKKNIENDLEVPSREKKEWILPEAGTFICEAGRFTIKIFPNNGQDIEEKTYTKWLDYDKIKDDLCVRTRREGDYLYISDNGGKKKLNRFFIDEKLPSEKRDHVFLIAMGNEILWVIGKRINAHYKITSKTKYICELHYEGGVNNERKN